MHNPESKRRDMTRAFFTNRARARRAVRIQALTTNRKYRHATKQKLHVLHFTTVTDFVDDNYDIELGIRTSRHWSTPGSRFNHWAGQISKDLEPEDKATYVASKLRSKAGRAAAQQLMTYDYINPNPWWAIRDARIQAEQDRLNGERAFLRETLRLVVEDGGAHRELNSLLRQSAEEHRVKTGHFVKPRIFLGLHDIDNFMSDLETLAWIPASAGMTTPPGVAGVTSPPGVAGATAPPASAGRMTSREYRCSWRPFEVLRKFASDMQERLV